MDIQGNDSKGAVLKQIKAKRSISGINSSIDSMVACVSRLLISAGYSPLPEVVQVVGEALDADRGIIIKFKNGLISSDEIYTWRSADATQINIEDEFYGNGRFKYWLERLATEKIIIFGDDNGTDKAPPEEIINLKKLGLTSFMILPVFLMDDSIGGLLIISSEISQKSWDKGVIEACQSISEMLGTVWNHRHAFDELSMYRQHLEELVYTRTNELESANNNLQKEVAEHKQTTRELQEYREHLENLVKSRTNELTESNKKLAQEIEDRKHIEKSLREAEEMYRLIIDNSQDLIYSMELDGRINFMGPQVSKYGYVAEDIIGHTIDEFIHEDDLERVINELDQAIKTGVSNAIEFRLKGKDGTYFDVEELGGPLFIRDTATQCIGIVRDISARNHSKQAIEESEERFRQLANSTYEAIEIHDGSKILEVNQASLDLFGYSREEMIGMDPLELAVPEHREMIIEKIRTESSEPYEAVGLRRDGSTFFGEVRGKPIEFRGKQVRVTAIRDITESKVAELALRESEKRYRILAENVKDVIWMTDTQLRYTYVSPSVEKVRGFTVEEVMSTTVHDHLTPESLAVAQSILKEEMLVEQREDCDRNRERTLELEIYKKDGTTIWTEHTTSFLRSETGKPIGLLGIERNIDERRAAERKLRESESKFRTLYENAIDLGLIIEPRCSNGFNNIIDCNEATSISTGFMKREIIGQDPMWLINNKDKVKAEHFFQKIFDERISPIIVELTLNKRDGGHLNVELICSLVHIDNKELVFAIGRDITARKQSDAALRESRKKYQELFHSIMEGISIFNENEDIVFCNPAFARLFDIESTEKIIGRNIEEFVDAEQKAIIENETKKRRSGLSSKYEVEIISATGKKKNLLCFITPRFDEHGNYIGTFGSSLDITETRRLQEFSSRAQRLETAGRIASQVAHDFNNLLGPMTAYPELIKEELPENHPAHKYLDDIFTSASRMADINQQLLTLGRRGHYNLEVMNLNEVVDLVLDQVFLFDQNIVLNKSLDLNLRNINGGKSQIYRAISNIVLNACDAMPEGGELCIVTENVNLFEYLGKFTKIPEGDYVKLTIRDTGVGIPGNILPRIFEPFFTSKASDKKRGSGLGLSVVHAVMEDHNAFIDWDSQQNSGTSFYMYFPVSNRSQNSISESHIVGGDESILVIDDDSLQRGVTRSLLEKLGYNVETKASGEEGLKYLENNPRDLVLLDMIMPGGMDGAETYEKILKINSAQKAIVVSGFAETSKIEEVLKLGVNTFLRKPLTLRSLAHAIRNEFDSNDK